MDPKHKIAAVENDTAGAQKNGRTQKPCGEVYNQNNREQIVAEEKLPGNKRFRISRIKKCWRPRTKGYIDIG